MRLSNVAFQIPNKGAEVVKKNYVWPFIAVDPSYAGFLGGHCEKSKNLKTLCGNFFDRIVSSWHPSMDE
jgi:hypothetical protein